MKISMRICFNNDEKLPEKFDRFIDEKRDEGWLLQDGVYGAYVEYEGFTEYILYFERPPFEREDRDSNGKVIL